MGNVASLFGKSEEVQSSIIRKHQITSVGIKGYRDEMEDVVLIESLNREGWYFALVFDGHGGNKVSEYLGNNFMRVFNTMISWCKIQESNDEPSDEVVISLLSDFCFIMDEDIRLNLEDVDFCGSTCCGVLMTPKKYYTLNIGDSRAVLVRDKTSIQLTEDHKPDNELERKRIYNAGSYVTKGRIDRTLSVSRAFGDFIFKKSGELSYKDRIVTCHPDVNVYDINPEDEYIIIGCDGLWDVHSSKRCVQKVLDFYENIIFYRKEYAIREIERLILNLKLTCEFKDNYFEDTSYEVDDFNEILNSKKKLTHDCVKLKPLSCIEEQLFVNSLLVQSSIDSRDNVSVILIKL